MRRIRRFVFKILNNYRLLKKALLFFLDRSKIIEIIPSLLLNHKLKNFIRSMIEASKHLTEVRSFPSYIHLNVTNACNFRCKFCEIHYFYFKAKQTGGLYPNDLSIDFVSYFSQLFDNAYSVELSSAVGEPFLNKNFLAIAELLKTRYKTSLSVTTNGSLLTNDTVEQLIRMKFDEILLSVHGSDKASYNDLQGNDLNAILSKIEHLCSIKKKLNVSSPHVGIHYLLCQINHRSINEFLDRLKTINIDYLQINHYYGGRNRLDKDVSFYFQPEKGNEIMNAIYDYAKKISLSIRPEKPQLIGDVEKSAPSASSRDCTFPWMHLNFKGCVELPDCFYIGVCNRIMLLRIDINQFMNNNGTINDIWNHQILQHFRRCVNKNSVCRFCTDPDTRRIRCTDNHEYSIRRDTAVREFLNEFRETHPVHPSIPGLYVLKQNPYEYSPDEKY